MRTAADIISLWPSAEHFAADLGLKYPSYGRVMKMRKRIPARYWPNLISAASQRGIDLTHVDLVAAHLTPAAAA